MKVSTPQSISLDILQTRIFQIAWCFLYISVLLNFLDILQLLENAFLFPDKLLELLSILGRESQDWISC